MIGWKYKIIYLLCAVVLLSTIFLSWYFRFELFYSQESKNKLAQESYESAIEILDSDTKKALEKFQFANRLNAENYNYDWQAGLTQKRLGLNTEAIETFERLSTKITDQPLLYIHLGEAYEDVGDDGKAIEAYGKATNLPKQFPTAYIRLANLLINQGKHDEAIKILEDGRTKNPESNEISDALKVFGK